MKKYYHATTVDNFNSIMNDGVIKTGWDGIVYLTETPQDALKFIALRTFDDIIVLEVEVDESLVVETFDHSYAFFKCKSYGCRQNISFDQVTSATKYSR